MGETGKITFDTDINGDKLYQKRAKLALPILVRQAIAHKPIYYSDLAEELNMPNPRNLNYVLGAIGNSLKKLSKKWQEEIPLINCIVLNKNSKLPGEGINWFIPDTVEFNELSRNEKKRIIDNYLTEIYLYKKWNTVLESLFLKPITNTKVKSPKNNNNGGESIFHKEFKEWVARNPEKLNISKIQETTIEFEFRSLDKLDILFRNKSEWVGVEVKSKISDEEDIIRGLFQCIKYKALCDAEQLIELGYSNNRIILVLESIFPKNLIPIKNILGIEVIDNIKNS